MSNLSISKAWDETRALFASEGRLFASVALALTGVPTMISGLIEPQGSSLDGKSPLWVDLLTLAAGLIALIGQLALVRLALKPSITVAGAIAHGARRMPIYLLTAFIVGLGLVVLAIPLLIAAMLSGIKLDQAATAMTPAMAVLVVIFVIVALFLGVRMLMGTPVASAEPAGPIGIITRSWHLTNGKFWKLLGFLVIILIGAGVVLMAIGAIVGSVATFALGPLEPMSTSALVLSLCEGLFNAAFTAVFAVMLARIYVQLSGRDTVTAPTSGT